jgi:hypothetical protein
MPDFPAHAKPRQLTRGDQLRDALARLKALVGQLGYALGEEALNIPPLFDEVTARLAELQAQGQDVRGEATQLETVSAELHCKAATVLRADCCNGRRSRRYCWHCCTLSTSASWLPIWSQWRA